MRAALYYRVSTPGQVDAFGFAAQKRLLPEYCARMGWTVVGEYEEPGVSGENLMTRPAMMQLLADAERGLFDVILVVEDMRLCRGSLRDWEYIKGVCAEREISLATPQGIFYRPGNEDDDFLTDIRGAFSKREKRQIARRMMRGRIEATEQGCLVQAEAPYGYRFERYGRRPSDKRLVIVPEQGEVIELIFRLTAFGPDEATQNFGSVRTCEYLNEVLRIPSPRGRRWLPTVVKRMIRNPVYRGEWYYGRYEAVPPGQSGPNGAKGLHSRNGQSKSSSRQRPRAEWHPIENPEVVPPIVTPALWAAANAAIDHRNAHGRGRPARKHPRALLASFLRCPDCGYAFHHYQKHQASGRVTRHYLCAGRVSHRQMGVPKCRNHRWPAEEVEAAVWGELVRLIESPELLAKLAADAQAQSEGKSEAVAGSVRPLRERLAQLEVGAERIRAAYRAGVYSLAELQSELEALRQERESLEQRLRQAEASREAGAERERALSAAVDLCAHYRKRLQGMTHDQKREIIETLVNRIELTSDGRLVMTLVFGSSPPTVTGDAGSEMTPASRSRSTCSRPCARTGGR